MQKSILLYSNPPLNVFQFELNGYGKNSERKKTNIVLISKENVRLIDTRLVILRVNTAFMNNIHLKPFNIFPVNTIE